MRILIVFCLLISGCSSVSNTEIDRFCRDLSVAIQKINIYSSNLANKNTTRTPKGGYYNPQIVVGCPDGRCETKDDETPPIMKHEPGHPDADKNGYVAYPPINEIKTLGQIKEMQTAYEMVVKHAPVTKDFFLNDSRAKACIQKYPGLDILDYPRLLER